jgi:short-subunit dehydrogenase
LDLERSDSIAAAVELVHTQRPSIDILINNAGISQRSLAIETHMDVTRRIFEVNTFGTITITESVVRKMLNVEGGQVVVVSSVLGRIGMPMRAVYSASKHALHGYVESVRSELSDQNIRFTLVCPGFVDTNISHNALNSDGLAHGTQSMVQASGMTASRCAHQIVSSIRRGKPEVLVGGAETLVVPLFRFFPSLVRWLFRTNLFLKKGENND